MLASAFASGLGPERNSLTGTVSYEPANGAVGVAQAVQGHEPTAIVVMMPLMVSACGD